MDLNNKTSYLHVYLSNSLSTFILKHAISFLGKLYTNKFLYSAIMRLRTEFPITPIPFGIFSKRTFPLYVMKSWSRLMDPVRKSLGCEGATWVNGQTLDFHSLMVLPRSDGIRKCGVVGGSRCALEGFVLILALCCLATIRWASLLGFVLLPWSAVSPQTLKLSAKTNL